MSKGQRRTHDRRIRQRAAAKQQRRSRRRAGRASAAVAAASVAMFGLTPTPSGHAVTTGPAEMLADIAPGLSGGQPRDFTVVGDTLYFTAQDDTHGRELWKTDGTAVGTEMVKDINPAGLLVDDYGRGIGPRNLTAHDGELYFVADDGTHGWELWRSDGTAENTTLVKDIAIPQPHPLTDNNSGVPDSWPYLTSVGGLLYFIADDNVHGSELWKTDGSSAGTNMVKDIKSGPGSSLLRHLTAVGDVLFFDVGDNSHGREVWKTDGSSAGTSIIKDINPGPTDSVLNSRLTAIGSTVYFSADDGVHGSEMWRTDGTEDGTALVADINPGAGDGSLGGGIVLGDSLLYMADDGVHGNALWRTNGTADDTILVKDLDPDSTDSTTFIGWFTPAGEIVYFVADDGVHGVELWKTDGSTAGTSLVKDVNPGPASGLLYAEPIAVGDRLYFTGSTDETGHELWMTDGTEGGTKLLQDINPGPGDGVYYSYPVLFEGNIYFAGDDGVHGKELWKLTPGDDIPADTTAPDTTITSGPTAGATIITNNATFAFEGTAGDTDRLQCSLDGAPYADCTSPMTFTGLTDGPHTVRFRAVDAAGNIDPTPAERSFTVAVPVTPVDTTPPDTTITAGPAAGATVTTDSVTFAFEGTTGDTDRLQCSLDGAAFADCTSPKTFTGLANGTHKVAFRAVDAADNTDPTPAERTFTVAVSSTPQVNTACVTATEAADTATSKFTKVKAKFKKAKKARQTAKAKKLKAKLKKVKQKATAANNDKTKACS